ncbi:hypothetical protein MASR2M39_12240 [Ignavibacteriales bacterium]
MKKYLDRDKIESLHREIYDPFFDPEAGLRSNFCISDQGKIFLLEHVQNLGTIREDYVEVKVQIYNTSTKDAIVEAVRISPERGAIKNQDFPGFNLPHLAYYYFSHRIPIGSLSPDFYILILSFFVKGENTEKLRINFSIPESIVQESSFEATGDEFRLPEIFDNSSGAFVVSPKKDNVRITLPRSNVTGLFKVSSEYADSRYLLAKFEDNSEVMIPPSGEYFSSQNPSLLRNSFQLHDDLGRAVNTLTDSEIVLNRDLNIFYKRSNPESFYKFYLKDFSRELRIYRKSNKLKIQQITEVENRLHLLVFNRVLSGDAFIVLNDKGKLIRIDIEFEDDVQPIRVLKLSLGVEGGASSNLGMINVTIPLKMEGVGRLRVVVNEKQIKHSGEITSRLIEPRSYSYDLAIPVDLFDLNGNYNLSLGFAGEDGVAVWYDVLCTYESHSRLFPDSQIGPIILSYGAVQEKQVEINLPPGEELTGCVIKLSGANIDSPATHIQNERVFVRLNETIEYSFFENFLVVRFSCFSPPEEYLTKLDLSVAIQTNTSLYAESLSVLIFYYEGRSKFYIEQQDGNIILKCSNSGEEQLIIYRICATHYKVKIEHLFSDIFFPVKVEANESQSFIILDTEEIKKPLELSIYYNNPTPKIIKLEV